MCKASTYKNPCFKFVGSNGYCSEHQYMALIKTKKKIMINNSTQTISYLDLLSLK